jgi:trigger factor
MIAEVARSKALATVLSKAKVVDQAGKAVDVSAFTDTVLGDGTDTSDEISADDLGGGSDDHAPVGGAKDGHGRKPGHEHYGHDHK